MTTTIIAQHRRTAQDVLNGSVRELLADIPGTLYEQPWKNFGHNRTEALELARLNLEAGRSAMRSGAHEAALGYLAAGCERLGERTFQLQLAGRDDLQAVGKQGELVLARHLRAIQGQVGRLQRIERLARVGNLYVNRNQVGAVVGVQPFGGCGLSGTGPKAGGPSYLLRFANERTTSTNTTAVGGNASLLSLGDD